MGKCSDECGMNVALLPYYLRLTISQRSFTCPSWSKAFTSDRSSPCLQKHPGFSQQSFTDGSDGGSAFPEAILEVGEKSVLLEFMVYQLML